MPYPHRRIIMLGNAARTQQTLDPDAVAYFTAAAITDPVEQAAANTLIVSLKRSGLWTILDRIYLFSPTSLNAASYCCKSLTQLTWINTPTHSTDGVLFDGISQAARMDIGPTTSPNVTATSVSMGTYINLNDAFDSTTIGCYDAPPIGTGAQAYARQGAVI